MVPHGPSVILLRFKRVRSGKLLRLESSNDYFYIKLLTSATWCDVFVSVNLSILFHGAICCCLKHKSKIWNKAKLLIGEWLNKISGDTCQNFSLLRMISLLIIKVMFSLYKIQSFLKKLWRKKMQIHSLPLFSS